MTATVHLLCGKVGSGKTTFARALEEERRAVRFSPDEWMIRLFGHHMQREIFDSRLETCKSIIYDLCKRMTDLDVDVILDFGFWSRSERDAVRQRIEASGAVCALYFFDVPDEILKTRLKERNARRPSDAFEITDEMFELFNGGFERPGADEDCVGIDLLARRSAD